MPNRFPIVLIFLAFICLLFVACAPIAPLQNQSADLISNDEEVSALVTHLQGTGTSLAATDNRRSTGLMLINPVEAAPLYLYQELGTDTLINLDPNSQLTLICSNDRVHRLTGPVSFTVGAVGCIKGEAIPAGGAHLLAKKVICKKVKGSIKCGIVYRDDIEEMGFVPFLIYPRSPILLTPPTTIAWMDVNDADFYQVLINDELIEQFDNGDTTRLDCQLHPAIAPRQICTTTFPTDIWAAISVIPKVTVVAYKSDKTNFEASHVFTMMSITTTKLVKEGLEQIQTLQLDTRSENLVLAGLYTELGLWDEAIQAYETLLALSPSARIYVAAGDLYQQMGRTPFAIYAYTQAKVLVARIPDDPALQAEIYFGLTVAYRDGGCVAAASETAEIAETYYNIIGNTSQLDIVNALIEELNLLRSIQGDSLLNNNSPICS